MAIIQTVNKYQIIDIVNKYQRLDSFGYNGWIKLFEYLEEQSESAGENIEVDIVDWCCNYTMHESAKEVFDAYDTDIDDEDWQEMDDKEKFEAIRDFLYDKTEVACCEEDCIIFANF